MGALLTMYPRERVVFPLILIRPWPVWVIVGIWLAVEVAAISTGATSREGTDGVNHYAHLGGFFGGFLCALALGGKRYEDDGDDKDMLDKDTLRNLGALATTDELKELYARIRDEDIPEVRDAWIERLLMSGRCPGCGRKLEPKGTSATCPCGKRFGLIGRSFNPGPKFK
jgi:hypothetical protein